MWTPLLLYKNPSPSPGGGKLGFFRRPKKKGIFALATLPVCFMQHIRTMNWKWILNSLSWILNFVLGSSWPVLFISICIICLLMSELFWNNPVFLEQNIIDLSWVFQFCQLHSFFKYRHVLFFFLLLAFTKTNFISVWYDLVSIRDNMRTVSLV